MSFRATRWAYSLRGLSGPEKAVLVCLGWHHNGKTGLCCPSVPLMAEETGLGVSTVKKAVASLIAKGLIERMPWRGGTAYMLAIVEPAEATREPAHIEQEKTKTSRGDFREGWKERRPAPVAAQDDGGRARAQRRIEETRAIIEPVRKEGTEEERAAAVARALAWMKQDSQNISYGTSPGSSYARGTLDGGPFASFPQPSLEGERMLIEPGGGPLAGLAVESSRALGHGAPMPLA